MEFKKRFNEILQQSGKTQVEIAKALNVTKQCVNDYKTGKSVPSIETLYALCKYLDVSSDYLLGLTELHTEDPLHPVPPFDKRLREILTEYNTSQGKLIRELPVSASVLYYWLSGKRQPTIPMLIKLAEYFDCSVDYLIGRIK